MDKRLEVAIQDIEQVRPLPLIMMQATYASEAVPDSSPWDRALKNAKLSFAVKGLE